MALATFNGEEFLEAQLESIRDQSRVPDELVVTDDGSSDRTVEILGEFAHRAPFQVTVRRNQTRLGYVENFFSAMRICTGDLIAFCDQDDVWHRDKLALCGAPFDADPSVAMVAHAAQVVDGQLRPQGTWYPRIVRDASNEPGSWGPAFGGYPGFAVMVRSSHLWYDGWQSRPCSLPPDESQLIPHDVWANLVCSSLGRVVALADELAFYRRHASNTSSFSALTRLSKVRQTLALRSEEVEFFRRVSAAIGDRARYLETMRPFAQSLGASSVSGLDRAVESFRRYAGAMERRARNYEAEGRVRRAGGVTRALARGDYSPSSAGGLGRTALLRDAVFVLGDAAR